MLPEHVYHVKPIEGSDTVLWCLLRKLTSGRVAETPVLRGVKEVGKAPYHTGVSV